MKSIRSANLFFEKPSVYCDSYYLKYRILHIYSTYVYSGVQINWDSQFFWTFKSFLTVGSIHTCFDAIIQFSFVFKRIPTVINYLFCRFDYLFRIFHLNY